MVVGMLMHFGIHMIALYIANIVLRLLRPHQVVVARAEAGNLIEAYTQLLWLDQDVSEILKPGCS